MTSPVIQCVTLLPKCVTLSLTVSPRHSLGGPQSLSASEGAWSSPQGRHCSAGSGRGPQPPADLDGTERQGHTGTRDEHMLTYRDTHSYHTSTLKQTDTYYTQTHSNTHTTHTHSTYICMYIHTHTHTYVHTHIHTHNVHIIFRRTYVHAYLPTSDGDGSHCIVDHTACEVCQQDAGGCQEHTCHCCTVLHQHCHSTGVLTTDH